MATQRKRMMQVKINPADLTVTWTFPGTDLSPIVLNMESVHADNTTYAALHGMNQRCSDNAAGADTPEGKRAAVAEMVEWYTSGTDQWDRPRVGGGARPFDVGLVVTALANTKTGGDVDRANRAIDGLAEKRDIPRVDAAKMFANDETIAAEMARIRAKRVTPAIDVDAELAALTA